DLADLLEVHPHRIVRRCLEDVVVALRGRGLGEVVSGNLDDLDPLAAEVLLDLRQELLDLLGGEVLDRNAVQEVFGGDEPALTSAGGDGFFGVFQTQITGGFGHPCSSRWERAARECTKRSA